MTNNDQFINTQLAELRDDLIGESGKIVGLQTDMRQNFKEVRNNFNEMRQDFQGLKGTIDTHTSLLAQILERLPDKK